MAAAKKIDQKVVETKTKAPKAAKPALRAVKPEEGGKRKRTKFAPLDRVFRKIKGLDDGLKGLSKLISRMGEPPASDKEATRSFDEIREGVQSAAQVIVQLVESGENLAGSSWKPTLAAKEVKVELKDGAQVWIKAAKRELYPQISDADHQKLFIEKAVGTKALIRYGKEAAGANTSKLLGFVPKTHLTAAPPAADDADDAA